jgi:small subunit ribosomal protein S9
MEVINAIGRRKAAVARVILSEGKGNITINKRELKEYFPNPQLQYVVEQPLNLLEVMGKFDIRVNLDGGGVKGQAEALRLGIARALVKLNADNKPALKSNGFLTRDPREVERKKPGQPKARKKFQFSKR